MMYNNPQMFPVDYTLRNQVRDWAHNLSIKLEFHGHDSGMDVWLVPNLRHCVLFALRWS